MVGGDAESLGIEVWRGGANTWECDEMGHLNVRFYLTRVSEGLVGLAAALGMPHAFAAEAGATLQVRDQHIRFLREANAGGLLHMRAGVVSFDETEALVLQVLYHSDTGEPAASFISRLAHVTAADGREFPWPRQSRDRAQALRVEIPDYAAPRSLDLAPIESEASLERARALNMQVIAAGAVTPRDCDVFGRMGVEQFIGRVSDGIGQLMRKNREIVVAGAAQPPTRAGGVVLEYRLGYLNWPRAGDRIAVYAGLVGAEGKALRIAHWTLDPDTGKAWGTSIAVAVTLDLDTRKIVPITPAALTELSALANADLGF